MDPECPLTVFTARHFHHQVNKLHTSFYFSKINFNIIQCMPDLPNYLLPSGSPTKTLCTLSPMHATYPTHLILLNLIT
jgi:hypothetical protein